MDVLIIVFVVMAIFHFIYESVILPSLLLNLKYKFEKLKDELIMMVIEDKDKVSPSDFNYVMFNLDANSNNLKNINFLNMFKVSKFVKANPNYKDENDLMTIDDVENKDVKALHSKSIKLCVKAVLYNSGMLIIYLFPILVLAYIATHIVGKWKAIHKDYLYSIASAREKANNKPIETHVYCYQ